VMSVTDPFEFYANYDASELVRLKRASWNYDRHEEKMEKECRPYLAKLKRRATAAVKPHRVEFSSGGALPRWKPRIVFSGHFMPNRYADVIGNQPTITFTLFPRDMDHFDSFFRSMKAALDALSETEIYFTQEEYDRIRKAADQ